MKTEKEILEQIAVIQTRIDSNEYSAFVLEMKAYIQGLKWCLGITSS
jgi:hypothetical protein